jgi:formylglycine-generating enzyme required for sulfatase activity
MTLTFFAVFLFPLLLYANDIIYWDDHRTVRQEKGKDLPLYRDAQFQRAREANTYREAWETYVAIQKEIPEEFLDVIPSEAPVIPRPKAEKSESARLMAWKEMKELLDEAKKNERNDKEAFAFLHSPLGAEPSQEPFQKRWEKAIKDSEFSPYDGFQFSWLLAPYLSTKRGSYWAEKMGDAYVEQGNFLRAYAQYKAIKDYSIAYNDRIEKKLNFVKEALGPSLTYIEKANVIEGLTLPDGTLFRAVAEKRGMHKEKTFYLEITFAQGFQPFGAAGTEEYRVIRKRIYDFELSHLNSTKYAPLLIRDEDKIVLLTQIGMTQIENTYLVFDLNGMLLEKKSLTEEIALHYGIKLLFSKDEFVRIPNGTFQMGSPPNEEGRDSDETLHEVKITKDFYLQRTEVTQLQWYYVTVETPSYFRGEEYCKEDWDEELKICPNHPVEQVSWDDVQRFISKLNDAQKEYIYRLPTEAEWEYSARGGKETQTAYAFGDDPKDLEEYAWFYPKTGLTHRVAAKRSTKSFGEDLYDIHGNVWEWVSDWHDDNYGLTEDQLRKTVEDPKGPLSGSYRVIRGGSWDDDPRRLRSALRGGNSPVHRRPSVGFRLLRQ